MDMKRLACALKSGTKPWTPSSELEASPLTSRGPLNLRIFICTILTFSQDSLGIEDIVRNKWTPSPACWSLLLSLMRLYKVRHSKAIRDAEGAVPTQPPGLKVKAKPSKGIKVALLVKRTVRCVTSTTAEKSSRASSLRPQAGRRYMRSLGEERETPLK